MKNKESVLLFVEKIVRFSVKLKILLNDKGGTVPGAFGLNCRSLNEVIALKKALEF